MVRNFGSVVKIAHSHEEFIALCRQLVQSPDGKAMEKGLEMAQANSWESIVQKIEQHIAEAIARKSAPALA